MIQIFRRFVREICTNVREWIMLSDVIAEVSVHGHANVSDPYGGPYLVKVWEEGGKIKMVRMANHRNVMLTVCDNWEDLAWHFQSPPKIYPFTRPFPFYIGEEHK